MAINPVSNLDQLQPLLSDLKQSYSNLSGAQKGQVQQLTGDLKQYKQDAFTLVNDVHNGNLQGAKAELQALTTTRGDIVSQVNAIKGGGPTTPPVAPPSAGPEPPISSSASPAPIVRSSTDQPQLDVKA